MDLHSRRELMDSVSKRRSDARFRRRSPLPWAKHTPRQLGLDIGYCDANTLASVGLLPRPRLENLNSRVIH